MRDQSSRSLEGNSRCSSASLISGLPKPSSLTVPTTSSKNSSRGRPRAGVWLVEERWQDGRVNELVKLSLDVLDDPQGVVFEAKPLPLEFAGTFRYSGTPISHRSFELTDRAANLAPMVEQRARAPKSVKYLRAN